MKIEGGRRLQQKWEDAYDWLSETERLDMIRFATDSALRSPEAFQDRLEQTALSHISNPRL